MAQQNWQEYREELRADGYRSCMPAEEDLLDSTDHDICCYECGGGNQVVYAFEKRGGPWKDYKPVIRCRDCGYFEEF